MVLYGRSAAHPAGAPLDLTDQVGPRRQQRKLEVNLKATIARPCDALTGPAFAAASACIAALAPPCSRAKCVVSGDVLSGLARTADGACCAFRATEMRAARAPVIGC